MTTKRVRSGWVYHLWKSLRQKQYDILCPSWRDDFIEFSQCISKLGKPQRGFTLKPVVPELGYCEGNVHIVPFNYTGGVTSSGVLRIKVGDIFNNWTTLQNSQGLSTKDKILCRCVCKREREVRIGNLLSYKTKGCGCTRSSSKYNCREHQTEYNSYTCMMVRCFNTDSDNYLRYGAKGITVCDRWIEGFDNFLDDMGRKPPRTTLDRVDPKGNYCKSNCRWASPRAQTLNQCGAPELPYSTKDGDKFRASYVEKGEYRYLGGFETKIGAFLAAVEDMILKGADVPEILMQKYLTVSKRNPTEL